MKRYAWGFIIVVCLLSLVSASKQDVFVLNLKYFGHENQQTSENCLLAINFLTATNFSQFQISLIFGA